MHMDDRTASFEIGLARTEDDLEGILALQRRNLETSLSDTDVRADGFVTVRHDLELLSEMNASAAHVVARADGVVVGYALVMLREFETRIPILAPMFEVLRDLSFRGRPLDETSYFVMGQVCVAEGHRGSGVFGALYDGLRRNYRDDFDLVVTEIATRNGRSRRAHEKVGFELLRRYVDEEGESWDVVTWDWSEPFRSDGIART